MMYWQMIINQQPCTNASQDRRKKEKGCCCCWWWWWWWWRCVRLCVLVMVINGIYSQMTSAGKLPIEEKKKDLGPRADQWRSWSVPQAQSNWSKNGASEGELSLHWVHNNNNTHTPPAPALFLRSVSLNLQLWAFTFSMITHYQQR